MLTVLDSAINAVGERNEEIALVGCSLVDRFQRDRTASNLEEIKNFVRFWLQDTSDHLARFRSRNRRRRRHFTARTRRKPSLGPLINPHVRALRHRMGLFEQRRKVLRQIGDAAVWIMLDRDFRRIAPLFKDGGHDLPTGIALAGVIQLQTQLHDSGHFLAMECDLTRCIGVGDLLLTRADGVPCTPLPLEVKTHSSGEDLKAGMIVELLTLTSGSGYPQDQDMLLRLTETIGKDLEDELIVSARAERQAAEIAERVSTIARSLHSDTTSIDSPRQNWRPLVNTVRQARQMGQSYDWVEDGVYYFAVRVRNNRDLVNSVTRVKNAIRSLEPGPLELAVSTDLHKHDELSGIALPFALWDVPLDVRAAILCNDVVVGTFIRDDLISTLLRCRGITLSNDSGGWRLVRGATEARLTPLHAEAARWSTVIGCVSPRSIVGRLSDAIDEMEGQDGSPAGQSAQIPIPGGAASGRVSPDVGPHGRPI